MPREFDVNHWPNRSTWLVALWLNRRRYGYVLDITDRVWGKNPGLARRCAIACAEVAEKLKRDILANPLKLDMPEAIDLDAVDWSAIANQALKRFEDYRGPR
jgi:phage tail protein X